MKPLILAALFAASALAQDNWTCRSEPGIILAGGWMLHNVSICTKAPDVTVYRDLVDTLEHWIVKMDFETTTRPQYPTPVNPITGSRYYPWRY